MTVQDLLRHTSGLTYAGFGDSPVQMIWRDANLQDENQTNEELVGKLANLPLMFEPGTTWEYSMSTDVLGRVVEVASGKSLAALIAERITGPLGMIDTAFAATGDKAARVAEPPVDKATGKKPPMRDLARESRWHSGGGGLAGTAADYVRFCQMLLNGGELDGVRILAPKTVALMASDHLPPGCQYGETARSRFGQLAPVPEMGYGFGLGFCVRNGAGHVAGAGLGRRVLLGRRHRHLFLDRPARADGRRADAAGAGTAAALSLSDPAAGLWRGRPGRCAGAGGKPMAGDDIAYKSALELTGLYRAGELSPVQATEALLARLDDLQPKLNAFCLVDRDGALASARASEQRWRDGKPLSPIDGVPATIKDLMLMRGHPTRRGSKMIDPAPDTEDSPAVARLKEAGAVILGKTTTPEFGWIAVGDSPLTGITRNPWNLERTPGGSSAGAAAACAAGIGVLNLGSDGAGSIRIPACFSGVFGIKPTFGRVPAYPPSPMGLLSHHGPITRRVADAALMLDAIGRPDPRDPFWLPAHDGSFLDGHRGRGERLEDRVQPRSRLRQGRSRDRRLGRQGGPPLRGIGRACRAGGQNLRLAARNLADPVGRGRGAGAGRLSGREARAVRPRPARGRRGRQKHRRGRLSRRRPRTGRARQDDGRVSPEIRSAADPDDAGAGAAGRRGPE